MANLPETSLSFLASNPPTSSANKVLFAAFVFTLTAFIIHCASPMRLTRVLVAAIFEAEKTYLEAVEAGVLSKSDVQTAEALVSLQIKISTISEASLRNSLSYRVALCEFFKGRTLTVLQCLWEVRKLETDIEILKEKWLRDLDNHIGAGTATRMVSLRRRQNHSSFKCHGH